MESLFVLAALIVLGGPIVAIIALARVSRLEAAIRNLKAVRHFW